MIRISRYAGIVATVLVVEKVGAEQLPVYPAGASAGTDGRWWGCVIGICVARRGGNTPRSFPLSSLHTHTYRHPLLLVIAFPTNCPLEYTFYCSRLLHRLRANMCLQEHCAGCCHGYTHMPESLVELGEVNWFNILPITSPAEVPIAMLIFVLHTPCCSLHTMHIFISAWRIMCLLFCSGSMLKCPSVSSEPLCDERCTVFSSGVELSF